MNHKHCCCVCALSKEERREELKKDIIKLERKIGDAFDYYLELEERYGQLGGWEMVEDRLAQAAHWAEAPLKSMLQAE